jgi:hypothetical protein
MTKTLSAEQHVTMEQILAALRKVDAEQSRQDNAPASAKVLKFVRVT